MAKLDPSRFYGARVPPLAQKLCREHLTFATRARMPLVDAHLKSNFAYFGSLDKTRAGFYILDDTGDDYTLLDLREKSGQVWFLDHDELSLSVRFDSLAAYATWRTASDRAAARAAKRDDADADGYVPPPRPPKSRAKRTPASERLWRRLRWLVWLLAQPTQIDDDEAVATAFVQVSKYPRRETLDVFERELKIAAKDPHVAIYWLLHFTCTGQDALRDRLVAAVAKSKHELLRAFVATFGAMSSDGELAVLPAFRKRRSRLTFELAPIVAEHPFELYLKAFEIDPHDRGLDKAVAVWSAATTTRERERVRASLTAARATGPGADYLRAELAAIDGKPGRAEWLLKHDPYRVRFLELALAGGAKVEAQLADARKVDELLAGVVAATAKAKGKATFADIDRTVAPSLAPVKRAAPAMRLLVARKIIHRAREHCDAALALAFDIIRTAKPPPEHRLQLLVRVAMTTQQYGPAKQTAARARKGDPDAIALARALLAVDERTVNEYHAANVKEMALQGLGSRLLERAVFGEWLALLGKPGSERFASTCFSSVLSPWERTSILKKLSPAQQRELALTMISLPAESKHSDSPKNVIEELLSPALHASLVATLATTKHRAHAKRYSEMLADFTAPEDSARMRYVASGEPAAELAALVRSWGEARRRDAPTWRLHVPADSSK